jgi:uncharacterized 2Fe-2S/4Fe-4S cluster protein (DUF4445 family)
VAVVEFQPVGKRVDVSKGSSLMEAAQAAGVGLAAVCGGTGSCGKCRVKVVEGDLTPATDLERELVGSDDLDDGWRLACQARLVSNARVQVPPASLAAAQRLQVEGIEVDAHHSPPVMAIDAAVDKPALSDLRSDATRLRQALKSVGVAVDSLSLPVLLGLPRCLRSQDWAVRAAVRGSEVVTLLPLRSRLAGLAVDIGTTKMAAYLVDLATGETLAKKGASNPQVPYGEDVVSRVAYANGHEDGLEVLRRQVVGRVNGMLRELCKELRVDSDAVVEATIVGNTVMHHLFLGIPVRQLGEAPYVPAVSDAVETHAAGVGLDIAPGGYVYFPPNIAGYVGADHVAVLLATVASCPDGTVLAVDIGTNTEVTLRARGRSLTCSCASGPAFEGAHIHDGMRAAPGAIERVWLEHDTVRVQTVDDVPAVGVCGSGILDAVAQMRRVNVLDEKGRIHATHPRVRNGTNGCGFVLAHAGETGHGRDITVSRHDVNEVQLAKAAIRSGIEVLMTEADIRPDQVDVVFVAGAFGTYVDIENALRIGMFPEIEAARFRQVGNAAGIGAKMLLMSSDLREDAEALARQVEYIELTTYPGFSDIYVRSLSL